MPHLENPLLAFALTLTPVAALDTSPSNKGNHEMQLNVPIGAFKYSETLEDGSVVDKIRNLLQIEAWILPIAGEELIPVPDGRFFIPPDVIKGLLLFHHIHDYHENSIHNINLRFSFPSLSHVIDPLQVVKCRIFMSQDDHIHVSDWCTDHVRLYNPPNRPAEPTALLVRGDPIPEAGEPGTYEIPDKLFMLIPQDVDHPIDMGLERFIVSYSYIDKNGAKKWAVSGVTGGIKSNGIVSVNEIVLSPDVDWEYSLYAAVYRVVPYVHAGINYYTLSELSQTVQAQSADLVDENPEFVNFSLPENYHIYKEQSSLREQKIQLNWQLSSVSNIASFSLSRYELEVYTGESEELVLLQTIDATDITELLYPIPESVLFSDDSTKLTFLIVGFDSTNARYASPPVVVNTFKYAEAPSFANVIWATDELRPEQNGIDLLFNFKNPVNVGYGEPLHYNVKVVDNNGDVKADQTVEYNSSDDHNYLVYFNNAPTSLSGVVVANLITRDTNVYEDAVLPQELDGFVVTQPYQSTRKPIIRDIVRTEDELRFIVVSSSPLVRHNKFIHDDGSAQTVVDFLAPTQLGVDETNNIDGDNSKSYTVLQSDNNTGNYEALFIFQHAFLEHFGLGEKSFHITVANRLAVEAAYTPYVSP